MALARAGAGGTGTSLVRGEQVELSAIALSVKTGGRIGQATVGGRIATRGDNLVMMEIDGELGSPRVGAGIHADGRGSDAVHVRREGVDLSNVKVTAAHGQAIVRRRYCSPPAGDG